MNLLKWIGVAMMALGIISIITAFPITDQSVLGTLAGKVPPISATRIIIGAALFVLGLFTYSGKEGLRLIGGREK